MRKDMGEEVAGGGIRLGRASNRVPQALLEASLPAARCSKYRGGPVESLSV